MACLMERSSAMNNAKTKKENQEIRLLSSSSGRFDQEGKKKKRDQEERRSDHIHHHQEEERRHREPDSSSLSNINLCNTRLERDRTYRGGGASGSETGSWQLPSSSSTTPQDPTSQPSASDSMNFAEKPPYFGRRSPSLDILPCSRPTDRMCSGKTLISGTTKTTEPAAGYGVIGGQGIKSESLQH
jgi:hypothetical protein